MAKEKASSSQRTARANNKGGCCCCCEGGRGGCCCCGSGGKGNASIKNRERAIHRTTAMEDMLFYGANHCKAKMRALTEANAAFSEAVGRLNHHSLMTCRSIVDAYVRNPDDAQARVSIKKEGFGPNQFFYSVVVMGEGVQKHFYVPESSHIPLVTYNDDGEPKTAAALNVFTAIMDVVAGSPTATQMVDWKGVDTVIRQNMGMSGVDAARYRSPEAYGQGLIHKMVELHLLLPGSIKGGIKDVIDSNKAEGGDIVCAFWFPARRIGEKADEVPVTMLKGQTSVLVVGTVLDKKTQDQYDEELPDTADRNLAKKMCGGMRDNGALVLHFYTCVPSGNVKAPDGKFTRVKVLTLQRNCTTERHFCTSYVRLEHANDKDGGATWIKPSSTASHVSSMHGTPIDQVPIDEYVKDSYLHLIPLLTWSCGKKAIEGINICSCNTRATNTDDKYWIQTTLKINYKCQDLPPRTETVRLTYIVANAYRSEILAQLNQERMTMQYMQERARIELQRAALEQQKRLQSELQKAIQEGRANFVPAAPVPIHQAQAVAPKDGDILLSWKQSTGAKSLQWGKDMQHWIDAPASSGIKQNVPQAVASIAGVEAVQQPKQQQQQQTHKTVPLVVVTKKAENSAAKEAVQTESKPEDEEEDEDNSGPDSDVETDQQLQQQEQVFIKSSPAIKMSTLQSFMRPRRDIASTVAAKTPSSASFLPPEVTPEGSQRMACFQQREASPSTNVKLMSSARHP